MEEGYGIVRFDGCNVYLEKEDTIYNESLKIINNDGLVIFNAGHELNKIDTISYIDNTYVTHQYTYTINRGEIILLGDPKYNTDGYSTDGIHYQFLIGYAKDGNILTQSEMMYGCLDAVRNNEVVTGVTEAYLYCPYSDECNEVHIMVGIARGVSTNPV